jgi:hypothetical protein
VSGIGGDLLNPKINVVLAPGLKVRLEVWTVDGAVDMTPEQAAALCRQLAFTAAEASRFAAELAESTTTNAEGN